MVSTFFAYTSFGAEVTASQICHLIVTPPVSGSQVCCRSVDQRVQLPWRRNGPQTWSGHFSLYIHLFLSNTTLLFLLAVIIYAILRLVHAGFPDNTNLLEPGNIIFRQMRVNWCVASSLLADASRMYEFGLMNTHCTYCRVNLTEQATYATVVWEYHMQTYASGQTCSFFLLSEYMNLG